MVEINERLPTRVQFSEQVGTVFSANLPGGENLSLTLIALDEIVVNEVQENFTLLFRAPAGAPLAQGIYSLSHETLAAMEIFLVPVKKDAEGLYLEAVFNNFVAKHGGNQL
jgi:hypothetical protein